MDGVKLVRKKVDPRALARPELGNVSGASITVKAPLESPQKVKKSLVAKILPLVFVAVILGMLAVMVITGRRQLSPYMLMMPLAMIGGLVGFNMHGGGGGGDSISELDANRKEYYNYLKETRKDVHLLAKQQFLLQQYYFPEPMILNAIVDREEFWARQPNMGGGLGLQSDRTVYDPFLSIRLGTGKARINPPLETEQSGPMDYLEPVTAIAFRRFMRTQSVINNMPIAVRLLGGSHLNFIAKDDARMRSLARAIIMGLCISHSPEHALVVVITNKPREHWEFVKWLPHSQHPTEHDSLGNLRLVFKNVEEANNKLHDLLKDRGPWTKATPAEVPKPLIMVVLDRELSADAKMGSLVTSPKAGTVIVDLGSNEAVAYNLPDRMYYLEGDVLRTVKKTYTKADSMTLAEADVLARKLAPYRAPDSGIIRSSDDASSQVQLSWMHALGVDDPGTFDPRVIWEKTSKGPQKDLLKFPIGIKYHNTQTPTGEYQYLDIKEAALAGVGPHGVLQGMTGTGKSYLMRGWILGALTLHSPEEINFICVDFKGYTTFQGLAGVPHIVSIITNMEEEADLMDRFADVIDGEISRRQRAFRETKTTDYVTYNKLREVDSSIPPMPALILMLDETQQFLKAHPEYRQKFETWGAIGRSLRIHIVICQQTYDAGVVGGFDNHRTYGISLTASSERASNAVVSTPDAAHLPRPGWAIVYGDEQRSLFRSFNISQIYLPSTQRAKEGVQRSQKHTTLQPFSVLNETKKEVTEAPKKEKKTPEYTEQELMLMPKEDAVLADRLSQFGNKARQMWLPPLNMPVTFADLPLSNSPTFNIPIGLADAPKMHDRPPMFINFGSAAANTRIIGTANAGKSLALQTIILGLSLVQPPNEVNFYIIDNGGGKLSYLEKLPHVGGYSRPNDIVSATRLAGEFMRILDIRKELFYRTGATTTQAYLDLKRNNPEIMKQDPYGRMYIVIDGFKTFRTMSQQSAGMAGSPISDQLLQALREGSNYGVYAIVTARQELDIPITSQELFRSTVLLKADEASGLSLEAKAIFKSIPSKYPGRGVDIARGLHMRIAVPQMEPLADLDANVKIADVYNDQFDYSAGSAAFVERILGKYDPKLKAPSVTVLAGELRREEILTPEIREAYADKIIMGIAEADAMPRFLPPGAPNFLFFGDPGSGKTTILRNYIQTIIEQKSPKQARFIIFDFQRALLKERELLKNRGYLNAYVNDFSTADSVGKQIDQFMKKFRTMPADVTTEQIMNKSWWNQEFPYELYIIVDDYHLVTTSQGNPLLVLAPWVATSRDTGIHFVISRNAGSLMRTFSDRFLTGLHDINTPGLLLSGPSSDKMFGSKFANRRAGQGELIDPASGKRDVIQALWIEELH